MNLGAARVRGSSNAEKPPRQLDAKCELAHIDFPDQWYDRMRESLSGASFVGT